MLASDETLRTIPIPEDQKELILAFLQGSVYCWCKNREGEAFSLQRLVGGTNMDWSETPLIVLYERHIADGIESEKAVERAAQDAGWLLKEALAKDKRKFEATKGYTAQYRWVQLS